MIKRDMLWLPGTRLTMRQVVERVAPQYGITPEQLIAGRQKHRYGPARHHAMWEMYEMGKSSLQIAHFLSLKDHTSVVYGRDRHLKRLEAARQERAA